MANMPLYYDAAQQVIPVTIPGSAGAFTTSANVVTDPASVVLVVTDPDNVPTSYTYVSGQSDPNHVVRDSAGKYHLALQAFTGMTPPPAGLWHYTWVGTGGAVANGAQVFAGSFRVLSLNTLAAVNLTYTSMEEVKSSLGATGPKAPDDDFEMQRACLTATTLINDLCGQHFYKVTEARTYSYGSIEHVFTDPFVKGSVTALDLDYDGDGVYEVHWTEGRDYRTLRYDEQYNPRNIGEDRPHDYVQVILAQGAGGQFLPFTWPWTPADRIKITATWGWKRVPQNVSHAALLLAVDLFKLKDAPWGVAGTAELGMVRVQSNPQIMELLNRYRYARNLVGI